jgi:8-oxo-dGTP diphosphatase
VNIRVRVAALIIKDEEILLVKHRKDSSEYWLLPGGGLEPGETLEEALERELLEETSLKIKTNKLLFISDSISPRNEKHIVQIIFKCDVETGNLKVNPDHRLCDAKYISLDKLNDIALRPNIKQPLLDYLNNGFVKKVYLGNTWE